MNLSLLFSEKMYVSFATLFLNQPAVGYVILRLWLCTGSGRDRDTRICTRSAGLTSGRPWRFGCLRHDPSAHEVSCPPRHADPTGLLESIALYSTPSSLSSLLFPHRRSRFKTFIIQLAFYMYVISRISQRQTNRCALGSQLCCECYTD